MDIIRNVGVCSLVNVDEKIAKERSRIHHRDSLPNIALKYSEPEAAKLFVANNTVPIETVSEPKDTHIRLINSIDIPDEECAISGRLQIRVVPSQTRINETSVTQAEHSPNPEDSIYYDAVTNGMIKLNRSDSNRSTSNNFDIKVYEDTLKIQKYKIVSALPQQQVQPTQKIVSNEVASASAADEEEEDEEEEEEEEQVENESENDQGRNKENVDLDSARGAIAKQVRTVAPAAAADSEVSDAKLASPGGVELNKQLKEISKNCKADDQIGDAFVQVHQQHHQAQQQQLHNANVALHERHGQQENSTDAVVNDHGYQGAVEMRRDHHGSKIPVLNNPNSRIAKCASWAGNEALLLQKELGELQPGKYQTQTIINKFCQYDFICIFICYCDHQK